MQGYMALIIEEENLNFHLLNNSIGLEPSRIVKKGQKIIGDRVSLKDRWIYKIEFLEDDFSQKVNEFIDTLIERKDIINSVKNTAIVEINFYINSEKGQFGYTLCTEQLSKISSFGININFHILSFGSV